MSAKRTVNRRIILNSRPIGAPTPDNFRLEETQTSVPGDGQVLLRTLYLSLDPYMRGRMSDADDAQTDATRRFKTDPDGQAELASTHKLAAVSAKALLGKLA